MGNHPHAESRLKQVLGRLTASFPSSPLIIGVPVFLIFGFNKETPQIKRAKGYHWGREYPMDSYDC